MFITWTVKIIIDIKQIMISKPGNTTLYILPTFLRLVLTFYRCSNSCWGEPKTDADKYILWSLNTRSTTTLQICLAYKLLIIDTDIFSNCFVTYNPSSLQGPIVENFRFTYCQLHISTHLVSNMIAYCHQIGTRIIGL